ncbi:MAG: hypothetical protein RLZZ299_2404 [Pseudomonadota bacterium]
MRNVIALVGCMGAVACQGGGDSGDAMPVESACGAVTQHALAVEVAVVDATGAPVAGLPVSLEERAWAPGVRGEGTTDTEGLARFDASGVVAVESCWGTAVDYVLVLGGADAARVEDGVNPEVRRAIVDAGGVLRLVDPPRVYGAR